MENVLLTQHLPCKIGASWRPNSIPFPKPYSNLLYPCFFSSINSSPQLLNLRSRHYTPHSNSTKHITLLAETFHQHRELQELLHKLTNDGASAAQILEDDGDWTKQQFWAVIKFLIHNSRSNEITQVFNLWENIEKSRINEFNYVKIIVLLCEESLMEPAMAAFQEMKNHGLRPSLEIYNSIVHGFARKGLFDDAICLLNEMKEIDLKPNTDTYNGLMQSYAKYKMYDEMAMCIKKMESEKVFPDYVTYNLLIREFSQGGLLKRMERVYQSALSRRMELHSSTLIAMLETYANYGIVEMMEKVYRRILNSKTYLKEDLVRKLARFYIENYMFSRLDDLAVDLSSKSGRTELFWCLRLLSHACLLSRQGMDCIVREMEETEVSRNITTLNIILLAYLKMKDFKHMRILLSELPTHQVKPDIVTFGIIFDSRRIGFDASGALETWRRMGFLNQPVEMKTDTLVLAAFGKGFFLKSCEDMYIAIEPEARDLKIETYYSLINLVNKKSKAASASELTDAK